MKRRWIVCLINQLGLCSTSPIGEQGHYLDILVILKNKEHIGISHQNCRTLTS